MSSAKTNIEAIQELLLAYAEGNYTKKLEISENRDDLDIIVAGINMLGEELESGTVSIDFFQSFYDAISDIIIVTTPKGLITKTNDAINEITLDINHHNQKHITTLFNSKKVIAYLNKIIDNKEKSGKFEFTHKVNGKTNYYSGSISIIHSKYDIHKGYLVVLKDVTNEKISELEIIETILDTQEKERRRFAYDLHDALGQELNSAKMLCESLMVMNPNSIAYKQNLEMCRDYINDCIVTTRGLSYELMPKSIEDGALFAAFEELERSNKQLISILIYAPEEEYTFALEKKINIYRIIQEFISNTLKHANASTISIKTFQLDDEFHFSISDNGSGYDYNKVTFGNGIRNIESRLKAIGANYDFTSKLNKGTKLNFNFS